MARVVFTANLARHVESPAQEVAGTTVREVLDVVFAATPDLRSYVLDDQNQLRKHMSVFVDGRQIDDRRQLSDPVRPDSEVFVLQALSGGA
ncbi:MAG TPA: MoaD/ThiS family protein [Polyangia bacterium]